MNWGQLQVIAGPDANQIFDLEDGDILVIGRGQNTGTRLKDPQISRNHCQVQIKNGKAVLTDNGSAGGTFVNGKKVSEQILRSGDIIQIGATQIKIEQGGGHGASTIVAPPTSRSTEHKVAALQDLSKELIGKTLSHYQIEKLINESANAYVFMAHDTESDKHVALKVLKPINVNEEDDVQRFIRAMKSMLPLKHANLIALYGAGRTGTLCWIAMEFIDGDSMTQVIDRIGVANMLDWRYALRVAVHVARALEYIHSHNIIHRNITPANIIIRNSDKTVKLGDTMFAKALEGTNAKQVTRPGELVGDVAYMAPERTYGGTVEIDGRSDIYGLGATVYALLTGRPPFESKSIMEMVQKIRSEEPAKPKKFQLSIPDLFEGVVMQMLAKRPQDRYQTAKEVLTELERVARFQNVTV